MTKRAVLYARVSSDDRHNESLNLNGQLALCREYAARQGYTVIEELAEDDRGASGASFELPQLGRVIEMARAGAIDRVIVRELDRLSRNLVKQLTVEAELKAADVKIEYALSEYPDTPEGNLSKQIRASIAEFEREQIKIRTTRARRLHAENGSVMLHGTRLYGYQMVTDGRKRGLEIDPNEARWVRQVFTWYTLGDENGALLSIREIVRRLTSLRVPTMTDTDGRHYKLRERGEWSTGTIAKMLSNETYAGTWRYGLRSKDGEPVAIDVPAIIDRPTFDAAQRRRAENRELRRRAPKYDYLMANGRLKCECGYTITPVSYVQRGKSYLRYGCIARNKDLCVRVRRCTSTYKRADVVDGVVWRWVKSLLTDKVFLEEALAAYQAGREETIAPLRERLTTIDGLLTDNRKQLEKLLDLYLAGDFPREVLLERKTRLQDTVAGLEAEHGRLTAQIEAQALTEDQLRSLRDFAARAKAGVEEADHDFAGRARLVALLDVHGIIGVENDQDVIHLSCILGEKQLCLMSTSC